MCDLCYWMDTMCDSCVWMSAGNVKKMLTQQVTRQDRAAVWPYCSPIKFPQILTAVKVQAEAVDCLLIGDKVRNSSLEVTFHLLRGENTLLLLRLCSVNTANTNPERWVKILKNEFTFEPTLGCSKQVGIHLFIASCINIKRGAPICTYGFIQVVLKVIRLSHF